MKKEYDFSKGERGKFYKKDANFHIPVYLEPEIESFFTKLANQKNTNLGQYIELRSLTNTRVEFFEELRAVSTYILFKNFELMLEWMIKSRQTDGNVDLTPYI